MAAPFFNQQGGDMGTFIEIDGKIREVVRVKSDNSSHAGYFTTYRDQMKPGEEEYFEPVIGEMDGNPGEGIQVDAGTPPASPVKHRRSKT